MMACMTFAIFLTASAIVLARFRGEWRRRVAIRSMDNRHTLLTLLAVPPTLIVSSECNAWIMDRFVALGWESASEMPAFFERMYVAFDSFGPWRWAVVVATMGVTPALGEELYCRGFLGWGLLARFGARIGVLLTALFFGVMHVHPVHAASAFLIGLAFHYVFLTARSLLAPILLHALLNIGAYAVHDFGWSNVPGLDDKSHLPWHCSLAAASALVAVGVLFYSTRVEWRLPDGRLWSPGYATAEIPPPETGAVPIKRKADVRTVFAAAGVYIASMVYLLCMALM
jgi:membrane protease YdiL (CAAX protease family)